MNKNVVTIRCDCGFESVVFGVYSYDNLEPSYELSFEDPYNGGHEYRGFFGRLKRAWHAFKAKPVVYNSLYTEDKEMMRKFFSDCLDKIN
jgi:hypothetical protein